MTVYLILYILLSYRATGFLTFQTCSNSIDRKVIIYLFFVGTFLPCFLLMMALPLGFFSFATKP